MNKNSPMICETAEAMSERLPKAVALLGAGAIGGGWAARFVLNGVDVRLHDPAAGAVERVQEQVANARRAFRRLTLAPLPPEGSLTVADSIGAAVQGVELVQESAPERSELKQELLAAADHVTAPEVLICSSTSSLRPSLLQARMKHPERFLVAHPFYPVYMLPLVELCAGLRTAPEALVRAAEIFRAVGMHPLVVRKEIDGFIANRLQEALWREALWLVHDDVATEQEVDDAIRYSFGLRRAINGPFRIGGGGAGMRRYMQQWGPMLKWPWTKLADVPELTDVFLNKLAEQADARDEGLSIGKLEEQRDDRFVAVLQALRSQNYGAGETLARWEEGLRKRAPKLDSNSGPLRMRILQMSSDWVDYNGHITESRYLYILGLATDNLLAHIGIEGEYRSKHGSYYTVETHLAHLGELHAGDRVQVLTQILGADSKRLHLFHVLARDGDDAPAATGEQMLLHVAAGTGRSGPVQDPVHDRLIELTRLHADLPRPARAGGSIRLR
ncbi:3-hydroxyacyl-CoA dehydrogenase NAD-binding domain-containing protein [Bradyrhizobium sp. RT4b]|uniref:3-hydroxyacyl-CoA dehydrogenase NAD-binding domain-containing protein n=1 Tax=Bradyrhizobium sp. RT4b TaxID=3156379 RepID=UPI0033984448